MLWDSTYSYSSSLFDHEIADISETEARIILTRDTELLKRKKITSIGISIKH
ncbi:MAG: Mut7-C RNAse domain-containing protein [Proteobacteria bacterium]|nr:Mut7-C RNAse domain-containing protein [Pseudomonadota bacterium]MBU1695861.1 Mut7-C RNAse domain-containing protein [Pseudomonadota bacterium]